MLETIEYILMIIGIIVFGVIWMALLVVLAVTVPIWIIPCGIYEMIKHRTDEKGNKT